MSCGGNCGGGCGGGCGDGGFTPPCEPGYALPTAGVGQQHNPLARQSHPLPLCGTLAQDLISVADGIRNLYAEFGLRTYVVRLIRTRWSGGQRNKGQESVVSEVPILPVPLVTDIEGLAEINTAVGTDEFGTIVATQISGSYTEDFLRGHDERGRPGSVDENFYWEIEYPPPCAGMEGERRRFTVSGAPMYKADAFQWSVRLTRQREGRARDGSPR